MMGDSLMVVWVINERVYGEGDEINAILAMLYGFELSNAI